MASSNVEKGHQNWGGFTSWQGSSFAFSTACGFWTGFLWSQSSYWRGCWWPRGAPHRTSYAVWMWWGDAHSWALHLLLQGQILGTYAGKLAWKEGFFWHWWTSPPVLPWEDMVADPQLVAFLQQFDDSQLPTLGSDGSCIIATGSEQWQRAQLGCGCALWGLQSKGWFLESNRRLLLENALLFYRYFWLHQWLTGRWKLLIDNQAICLRLERGLTYGDWSGDLPGFWHSVSTLVIAGTSCVWIPSHGKQPLWKPPAGWLDALLCRQLNARADAAASEICGQFRPGIEAALVQLAEARKWSTGVFQAQLAHSRRFWQVLLSHGSRLEPGRNEDDWCRDLAANRFFFLEEYRLPSTHNNNNNSILCKIVVRVWVCRLQEGESRWPDSFQTSVCWADHLFTFGHLHISLIFCTLSCVNMVVLRGDSLLIWLHLRCLSAVSCYALRMNFREEKHQLLSRLEKFQLDQARQKFPPRNRWLFVLFGGWIIFGVAFEWHLEGILS